MGRIQKQNVIPLLTQPSAAYSSRGSRTIMTLVLYFLTRMGDLRFFNGSRIVHRKQNELVKGVLPFTQPFI